MPSERGGYRGRLRAAAEPELKAGERIVALLPFATDARLIPR